MSESFQSISALNWGDAIQILNISSRGMSFEWQLELFSYLLLWQYWNFTPQYSLIRYVDAEPAAIALNCADPESREAYNFYWGALPKFRNPKISLALFDTCCQRLQDDGYITLHGDAAPERPVRRYRFVQAQPHLKLLEMQTAAPNLPSTRPTYEICLMDVGALPSPINQPGEPLHWCQRPAFLSHAASFVQILGAFSENSLKAYAVALTKSSHTTLCDIRSPEHCFAAGNELLRYVMTHNFCPPLKVTHILEDGYAHQLLTSAGFTIIKSFHTLVRDLRPAS